MESAALWQAAGFYCVFFMFFMYTMLDGFDLGVGMLIGFVARSDDERRTLLGAISPFWDGNEVWLIIALSTFFAAFPIAYSRLLPPFYLPLALAILLFVFRAVSLEFSYAGKTISRMWLTVFSLSSLLAASAGFVLISLIVSGIPTTAGGEPVFAASALCHPFLISFSMTGVVLIALHSLSYLAKKTDGPLNARVIHWASGLWGVFMVLLLSCLVLLLREAPSPLAKAVVLAGVATILAGAGAYRIALAKKADRFLFMCSSLIIGGMWLMATGMLFPNIINPVRGDAEVMTIYNTSAPLNSLRLVVLTAVVGSALVGAYTAYVYKAFGGRRDTERRTAA